MQLDKTLKTENPETLTLAQLEREVENIVKRIHKPQKVGEQSDGEHKHGNSKASVHHYFTFAPVKTFSRSTLHERTEPQRQHSNITMALN